jgi:ribonuclease R
MLLANETVAEHFYYSRSPFVYRVHERPDPEKMAEFGSFIAEFGLQLKGNPAGIRPRELSRLLHQIEGKPEENIISSILLRSMRKAAYSAECLGHFGLALKYYCHFTSPIRRYPDLIIHRIIKESLTGPLPSKRIKSYKLRVANAAQLSSEREQQAVELEREAEKLKKTELMVGEVGRQYTAVISGVTSFGIFAALENTIEGLIRMEELYDDYYEHDPKRYRLVGRDSGRVYALGDRLKIAVKSADVDNREINFTIVK